jgi:hypothetical protein
MPNLQVEPVAATTADLPAEDLADWNEFWERLLAEYEAVGRAIAGEER